MPKSGTFEGSDGKYYTLYYSTDSGDGNLTVGFYLDGPDNVMEYIKTWDFGDGTPVEIDHSIVQNHFYEQSTISRTVTVTVIVKDSTGAQIVQLQIPITITTRKTLYVSNFYQTEGAIIDGSDVGLAIDTSGVELPTLIYDWDNKGGTVEPLDDGKSQNPNHVYKQPQYDPPYNGIIKLLPVGTNNVADGWNFSVMVLPNLAKYVLGWIDCGVGIGKIVPKDTETTFTVSGEQWSSTR